MGLGWCAFQIGNPAAFVVGKHSLLHETVGISGLQQNSHSPRLISILPHSGDLF